MIRFMPDTWVDAVMRPIAMAAPNGWVYIEIMAPDFRFALSLAAAVAAALLGLRAGWRSRPTWVLLAAVMAAFIPWLYTSGNGRYFMPFLLAVGPVFVALVYHMPLTKAFRLAAVFVAVAIQGVALAVNSPWKPWDAWEVVRWREAPYFDIQFRPDQLDPDATYVTVFSISFSLVAPQFPASSRWINLTTQTGAGSSEEAKRTRDFLRSARALKVLLPSTPTAMTMDLQPDYAAKEAIDASVARHQLRLSKPAKCDFFPSKSLYDMALVKANDEVSVQEEKMRRTGFWVCPLVYDEGLNPPVQAAASSEIPVNTRAHEALRRMEALCPRFFQPGQTGTNPIENGQRRHYPSSDVTVYVLDNGDVYYKYDRTLNPHKFGTVQGLLDGSEKPECRLRGRTGLPWEREI
jgi:hypothetical protein